MSAASGDDVGIVVGIVPTASLDEAEWEALYRICLIWFTGYGMDFFREECGKSASCVLMRRGDDGQIVGFATLHQEVVEIDARRAGIFYTGHCFALKEHWGGSTLVRNLLALMARVMDEADPAIAWYWHYSAIGYRSYRYMPLLFRHFIPHREGQDDAFDRALRDRVGQEVFGECYEPGTGLVDWDWEGYSLSDLAAGISDAKLSNSAIALLERVNPRWAEGVEILCQARLAPENRTRLGERWMAIAR